MPTAAKLVAAVCLAALAFFTGETIKTLMPASTDFGMFTFVNIALGLVVGWLIMGPRAGRGMSAAISNGVTGTVALVFWALFVQAANEMVARSMARKYDTVMEALAGIFELIVEYGTILLDVRIILMLLCGGILTGIFAEIASARWR